jgi:hypothetical protein
MASRMNNDVASSQGTWHGTTILTVRKAGS